MVVPRCRSTHMQVKTISPAMVEALSNCEVNGLPVVFGAGYSAKAASFVTLDLGTDELRSLP